MQDAVTPARRVSLVQVPKVTGVPENQQRPWTKGGGSGGRSVGGGDDYARRAATANSQRLISSRTVGSGSVSAGSYSSRSLDVVAPRLTFPTAAPAVPRDPPDAVATAPPPLLGSLDLDLEPVRRCLSLPEYERALLRGGDAAAAPTPDEANLGELGGLDLREELREERPDAERARPGGAGTPSAWIPADMPWGDT